MELLLKYHRRLEQSTSHYLEDMNMIQIYFIQTDMLESIDNVLECSCLEYAFQINLIPNVRTATTDELSNTYGLFYYALL